MASITVVQNPTLVSTNVAGSAYAEWASGTGYTVGQRVRVSFEVDGTTPRFPIEEYEATGASTGAYPPTASVDQWVKVGAQNAHAMFDLITDQPTIADEGETISISLTPEKSFNKIVFLGISNVNLINLEIVSGGVVVHTNSLKTLSYDTSVGWWTYLFRSSEYSYKRSAVFNIPSKYPSPTINVSFLGPRPSCGWAIVGTGYDLGPTEWEAEANPKDYSRFDTNDFGTTTFVSRRVVDDVRGTLWIDTKDYNRVYYLLRSNMNTLAFYDLNNEETGDYVFDSLRVYGKLESVSGGISYGVTPINVKISGLS